MNRLTTGVLILSLAFAACKDAGAPEGTAPAIPPEATFLMDFSDFQSGGSPVAPAPANAAVGSNWTYAALTVAVWNTVLTLTLATPVAAFRAAVSQTPVGENGAWVWRYNFTALGAEHSARLEGRPATNGITWDMYISRAGEYEDFHWYDGFSNLTATAGTWALRLRPAEPVDFLDIEWTRAAGGGSGEVRYTNVVPNSPDNGSYIRHALTAGATYDALFELANQSQSNVTEIEWNRAGKAGRVRDPLYFGDADWHCWNGSLDNVAC